MEELIKSIRDMIERHEEDTDEIERYIGVACQVYAGEENQEAKDKLKKEIEEVIDLYKKEYE